MNEQIIYITDEGQDMTTYDFYQYILRLIEDNSFEDADDYFVEEYWGDQICNQTALVKIKQWYENRQDK